MAGATTAWHMAAASAGTSAIYAAAPLTVRMTVAPGDSLWSLSRRYGNPEGYIEDNVDAMAKANGLNTASHLVVGQRLLVPVSNPMELARLQTHLALVR